MRYRPLLLAVILLLIAASRIPRLPRLEPDADESWTIWQTLGTPQQIIEWTPYDWGPVSYLTLGAWKWLTGLDPTIVRLLFVYVFLIGAAFLYRVVKRIHGQTTACIAMLGYAAFGYGVVISTWIRGYVFILALTPLALWLTVRYFDRPSMRHALMLAGCMALELYIHPTAVLSFSTLGLYTLFLYRRVIWRWWLPGVLWVVFCIPEIINKAGVIYDRAVVTARMPSPPFLDAIPGLFANFFGWGLLLTLWIILFVIATALILYHEHLKGSVLALLVWVAMPLPLYILIPVLNMWYAKHYIWVMVGVVIWVAWGLSRLPRAGVYAASALLVVGMFWPMAPNDRDKQPVLKTNMEWLSRNIQWGDVILIDPNCTTAMPEEWDYYTRAYFPQGLHFVNNPEGYRRVWYVKIDGWQDPKVDAMVKKNRIAETFIGPWNFLFRLYEAPPDVTGITFDNGMRFHGIDLEGQSTPGLTVLHEGETVKLRMWWSVDRPVERDYSVGVYFLNLKGEMVAQHDGPPQVTDAPRETSHWEPGRYYIEERELTIPNPTQSGRYAIWMAVYQWWDNTRIAAQGINPDQWLSEYQWWPNYPISVVGADQKKGLVPIASITVKSF